MDDMRPWIGFDLDGTLAVHMSGDNIDTIGEPIPLMIAKALEYINEGTKVKIVTARVSNNQDQMFKETQRHLVEAWCIKHLGVKVEITCEKDFRMLCLYDDRCKQVIPNTGQLVEDLLTIQIDSAHE